MIDYESELQFLTDMTPAERSRHFIEMDAKAELSHIDECARRMQEAHRIEKYLNKTARSFVLRYNEQEEESDLLALEQCTQLIEAYVEYRATLRADIKETRERVRWYRAQYLQKMQEQPKN